MGNTPEGKVKKKVINILKFHNAWYCSPATRGMGRSGVPDILVCLRGVFIGIEVKRDRKHLPTKLQEHELWKLQRSGGWGIVIHNDNLLDLEGLCSTIVAQAELTRQSGHAKLEEAEAKQAAKCDGNHPLAVTCEDPECWHGEKRHQPKPDDPIN